MAASPKRPPDSNKMREHNTVEARRSRGEISCAECRRLKLKCDKTIPCGSCVKRGCSELCPNRAQATVHGSKHATAEIERLRAKVKLMSKRMHHLEEALASAHASSSSVGPHPLLNTPTPEGDAETPDSTYDHASPENETIQVKKEEDSTLLDSSIMYSFSELAITDCKSPTDDGVDTSTELLNIIHLGSDAPDNASTEKDIPTSLPIELAHLCKLFPLSLVPLGSTHHFQDMLHGMLPRYERATALVEAYLENISWFFKPVSRDQIMEELIPAAYKKRPAVGPESSTVPTRMDVHDLALLLAVFALGAVSDLTQPPANSEGELYRYCCLATLSLKSIFDYTTLSCIQATSIIANYEQFACRSATPSGSFKMMNLSCTLALHLGLHREASHAKYPEKTRQRRRMLFWELYGADCCNSFASGRPAIFKPSSIDCAFPDDPLELKGSDGVKLPSVWIWRARFIKEVISEVVEKLNSAQSLKYSEILALDHKIRSFDPFDGLRQSVFVVDPGATEGSMMHYIQRNADVVMKGNTLTLLHRNFFARSILENTNNPAESAFAPSFLAAYRTSVIVLRAIREHYEALSHLLMRVWPMWASALASTVIVGSVAALGSRSPLAREAFAEFDKSIGLFAKGQMHPVAKSGLPVLLRLRERAFRALTDNGTNVAGIYPPDAFIDIDKIAPEQPPLDEFNVINALGRVFRRSAKGEFGFPSPNAQVLMNSYTAPMANGNLDPNQALYAAAYASPGSDNQMLNSFPNSIHPMGSSNMGLFAPETPGPPPSSSISSTPGHTSTCSDIFQSPTTEQKQQMNNSFSAAMSPLPNNPFLGSPFMNMQTPSSEMCSPDDMHAPSSRLGAGPKSGETSTTGSTSHGSPASSAGVGTPGSEPLVQPSTGPKRSQTSSSAASFSASNTSSGSRSTNMGINMGMGANSSTGGQQQQQQQPMLLDQDSPVNFADFDVSYDLRLGTGAENPSVMSQDLDMEAWMAIMEDPRMMGFRDYCDGVESSRAGCHDGKEG